MSSFDANSKIWYKYKITQDDVIKWKRFPRYWPLVGGIHRSPVDSPHKGQWCRALVLSLICTSTNGWAKNRDAGDLRSHRGHDDVTVIKQIHWETFRHWVIESACTARIRTNFKLRCIMTSSNGNIFCVTGHLCGEFTGPRYRSFHVFFDLLLNKRLSKQSWGWWFKTLSCPLWRHRNDMQYMGRVATIKLSMPLL